MQLPPTGVDEVSENHSTTEIQKVDLRVHRIVGGSILFLALLLNFSTIAPTTSYWDCGEFIASSYSLAVPHPPGAPFYLLLGRVFAMLVPVPDIGLRVNSLSALLSGLTVLLTYLIIVRLIRRWRGDEHSPRDKIVLYGSGAIGAFAFASSHSFWFNAVEAEVYAISMFVTALVVWLAVRWMDHSERPGATKYLLLIAYFVGLSTGVHLLNVLAFPFVILLIYFQKYKFSWKGLLLALAVSAGAILVVYPGVVSGVPKLISTSPVTLLILLLAGLGLFVWSIRSRQRLISTAIAGVFLVLIGYSTYTMIYIRSNLDPEINENQPDTIQRFISYLNREQYGSVGPVEVQEVSARGTARLRQANGKFISLGGSKILRFNILERKAPFWEYQIKKMYLRYLAWQYFVGELGQPLIMPFLVGIFGLVWHFWRDPKRGFCLSVLFLMTGLAVTLYLNQEDPQPRERDYAYVGSFFAFAIWIGIGVTALVETVEDLFRNKGEIFRRSATYGTMVLAAGLIPVNMVLQNYNSHDRTGNYVAWDYSRNMLESCDPGGIIFTNGDNDTFPLWYLQVVEEVRRDVRVVNLSLLNTNWYIKQLRDKEPRVPIGLSDRDIDERLTGRSDEALLLRYWPEGRQSWRLRGPDGEEIEWKVPPTMYIRIGLPNEDPGKSNFLRVQDVMILHIIEENRWRRPIYFAVTVSNSNMLGLNDFLQMEGLGFRLHPKRVSNINEEKIRRNLFFKYADHYRNLDDPSIHYFGNVKKLLQNYRSAFVQLAYEYYKEHKEMQLATPSGIPEEQWEQRFEELSPGEKTLFTLRRMDEVMPMDVIPFTNREVVLQLGRLLFELGDDATGRKWLEHTLDYPGVTEREKLQAAYYFAEFGGDLERAKELLEEIAHKGSSIELLFNIAAYYNRLDMKEEQIGILEQLSNREDLSERERLDLAAFFYGESEYEKSLVMYRGVNENNPKNLEAIGGMLEVYRTLKDTPNAVELLQGWLKDNPNDARASEMLNSWSLGIEK